MPTGDLPTFVDLVIDELRPRVWHQYPTVLPSGATVTATQFNPASRARFSAIVASPPRAMYYAGSSREAALWESRPLRDVIGIGGIVPLSRHQFRNQRLVELRSLRPLRFVDLDIKKARRMVATIADLDLLENLKQTSKHERTHATAAAILALAAARGIALDGLMWRSKQHGTDTVFLLFDPPVRSADLEVIAGTEIALDDQEQAWPAVDAALAQASLRRATADDAAGDAVAESP
ncbi:RES domain-containing protein [Tahibacter aquaticus]|uniref:RES domain-containing protein n=1 Tax=Tahibacter aquaticus TaxID=520092 RepID=A0A4R6YM64_9GAMM|nr:RES domain-containing protein [Tahibacter aquaticus]TDR38427.1 RES domain-containing protein [Tahibacter aquaticus]